MTETPDPSTSGTVNRNELREFVDQRIEEIRPPEDDRESDPPDELRTQIEALEERIDALERRDGDGGGDGGEVGDDLRKRLEAMLARLDTSLRDLESSLSRVVGPAPDDLTSDYHSTPGWGVHFEADYPIRLMEATVVANQSGYVNVELHKYDPVEREPKGLTDSTMIGLPGEGTHTIDLDLAVTEPGHYVLTRDFSESPPDDDRVAMRRTDSDYLGWMADSGEGVTFHGGADAGGRWGGNRLWYYFANLRIKDNIPDPEEAADDEIQSQTGE